MSLNHNKGREIYFLWCLIEFSLVDSIDCWRHSTTTRSQGTAGQAEQDSLNIKSCICLFWIYIFSPWFVSLIGRPPPHRICFSVCLIFQRSRIAPICVDTNRHNAIQVSCSRTAHMVFSRRRQLGYFISIGPTFYRTPFASKDRTIPPATKQKKKAEIKVFLLFLSRTT